MKEKNLNPIHVYKADGKIDTRKTFYFGSKATVRETPGGNLILKVYNTDIIKIMTTGRVEVTHYLNNLLPLTLKAVNHFLRLYPNNLMKEANKKGLTQEELFKYKKKIKATKKSKLKDVIHYIDKEENKTAHELIASGELENLPF